MKCKRFVFTLTSGQLANAGFVDKLQSKLHYLICPYCRAFKHNDDKISKIIGNVKKRMMRDLG